MDKHGWMAASLGTRSPPRLGWKKVVTAVWNWVRGFNLSESVFIRVYPWFIFLFHNFGHHKKPVGLCGRVAQGVVVRERRADLVRTRDIDQRHGVGGGSTPATSSSFNFSM